MSVEMFAGFAIGAFTGFLIAAVFAGTKFHELHEQVKRSEAETTKVRQYASHLEQQVNPRVWVDDDPQRNIKVRKRLYDEYENLVVPGRSVIRIQEEGDIPEMSDLASRHWRDKLSQGGES